MSMRILLSVAATCICVTGCVMAPKYTRPEPPIPEKWPRGPAYKEATAAPKAWELDWRKFFTDKRLRKIVEMALKNNRDLKLAALNVEHARALYGVQRAELFPALNAVGTGSKQRSSADFTAPGQDRTTKQFSVGLGITSWEIDFFGRIRSLKERALEEYLATEEARRSAQILLVSEVARVYLTLAADRENLKLARSTLETQQGSYALVRRQYDAGLANELDLRRAQTQVDAARADVARYTQLAAQDRNALNLLAGRPVPDDLLPSDLTDVTPPEDISPGLPSEALLRRPDIMAAEHRLKAAYAFIGAARAAFFPRIALTTALGTASDEFSNLLGSGAGTWNFTPQMVMPIFDARTWAAYRVSKAQREIALTQYEKVIQTAFREVADTLAVRGTVDEQLSAQQSLVKSLDRTYRLALNRYQNGIDSYLSVLDAQRSLFAAQQGLVYLRLAKMANLVRLYAVLGGGGEPGSKVADAHRQKAPRKDQAGATSSSRAARKKWTIFHFGGAF